MCHDRFCGFTGDHPLSCLVALFPKVALAIFHKIRATQGSLWLILAVKEKKKHNYKNCKQWLWQSPLILHCEKAERVEFSFKQYSLKHELKRSRLAGQAAASQLKTCPLVTVMRENGHFLLSLNKIVSLFPKKKSVERIVASSYSLFFQKHPFKLQCLKIT